MIRRLRTVLLSALMLLLLCVPAHAEGVSRALLIGCDLFVSQDDTSPAAENNVTRMHSALDSAVTPFASITASVNDVVSDVMLEALVQETFGDAQEGDVSYFYISTHGLWKPGQPNEQMMLLLSDGEIEGYVTARRLRDIFDRIPGTKVLILDACHSGAMIGKGVNAPFTNIFAGSDYKVLCSSGGAEQSWLWTDRESGKSFGAGYFSNALTSGVSSSGAYAADINRDGDITLTELKRYLLANHGASTTRCYPEEDDFIFLSYDPAEVAGQRRSVAVEALSFASDVMDGMEPTVDFTFTVRLPSRIAYQLVHQEKERWDFANVTLLWDNSERYGEFGDASGYLSPGQKERTISISREDAASYGYVLLQMLTIDSGEPRMLSSRVLCVPPLTGDPLLECVSDSSFAPAAGEEFTFNILHRYPCEMTVVIEDPEGNTVRRLASRQATRPEHLRPLGSTYCWTGLLADGTPAAPGEYRIRATAYVGSESYEVVSEPFTLQ